MVRRSAGADLVSGLGAIAHLGAVANLSDDQLLEGFLARSGEAGESAFEALVARHGPMVLDVCRSILRDPHDAQDAFQATFLVLSARAGSIRRRESLAGWLLGVARRVALRSRSDLARRRAHEGRAAELRADRPVDAPSSWPELHEEIGRLPGRYREPLVLCYLEGLSTDAAAARLGCPKGTVLSRLSRARERLRDGLTRRGLTPGAGLLAAAVPPSAVPRGLLAETARASSRFLEQPATAAGLSTNTAVALARGVMRAMMIDRLKMLGAAILTLALIPGGLRALGGLAPAVPAGAAPTPAAREADPPRPGPDDETPGVRSVDRLDFGDLRVGAIAEARPAFEFRGVRDPGLSLKIDVPPFAKVKDVRLIRRGPERPDDLACMVVVGLDTRSPGKLEGRMKVHLGGQEAVVPIAASVAAREPGRPKVLVISYGFGDAGRGDYYRPWFDLVQDAGLDVSYMESPSVPYSGHGELPEELTRFDVILLADGGVVDLGENRSALLANLAESGKRVIVIASPASADSVLHANRILEPMGMHMDDQDVEGPGPGYPLLEAARLRDDPLLEGVRKLSTFRPAPIEVRDPKKARILAYFSGRHQGIVVVKGFVAVARHGKGEVVAIGMTLLPRWIGEGGRGTDNARFLKNLLTAGVGR